MDFANKTSQKVLHQAHDAKDQFHSQCSFNSGTGGVGERKPLTSLED